jgi:hypothetical protein
MSRLSVSVIDGVVAIDKFATEIDRFNAASARPNPFMSSAYLRTYALHSEYHVPGDEERLYVIRDGDRVIGCAPMRRTVDPLGRGPLRLRSVRLRFLAPFDTEQPGILAAPADEARVAAALIDHLCNHESGWALIECIGQRPGGAMHRALHAAADRFRIRDIPAEPYNEVPIAWPDLAAFFRSLGKKRGNNISRQARRLFGSGEPEIVFADGAAAVTAWFDAYCDLDSRSWKHGTFASIQRAPRRVRFFREIIAGRAGLDPSFIGIVFESVLIAGLVVGSNATASPLNHGGWCLEMAYDLSRADLGPGQLLLLLAIGKAIERGDRHLNFLQNFAYYKHRWHAEPIEVVDVQLIRRASLHNVATVLRDLRDRWRAQHGQAGEDRAAAGDDADKAHDRPVMSPEALARARRLTTAALAYDGTGVRRLDRAQSRMYLPFNIE